ncbi:hypothetical protein AVEN_274202-1 [Araneus ventricosus]|uniref:Uncharacterized protein n=1 Tax=Araneus ventricosus TaxID=182803 RepID=A0A4Y2PRF7_ARAVE|nr:hypothetical protein AVEN_274202-1 [Araneus ventricosus]
MSLLIWLREFSFVVPNLPRLGHKEVPLIRGQVAQTRGVLLRPGMSDKTGVDERKSKKDERASVDAVAINDAEEKMNTKDG